VNAPRSDTTAVLVTGATGYIGGRLVPELLDAGHEVRCFVRNPAKLAAAPWSERATVAEGDIADPDALREAMAGIDVAYFLVHSMGGSSAFDETDRRAATAFREAAADAGVSRIVYLGGLGRDEDPTLSRHLRSRHEVGRVLADGPVPVTELRAALIIGAGSASFEMLRYLVEVLPAMVTPRWVDNRCQPLAVRDVLRWLVGCATRTSGGSEVVEVGGPDVLTYRQMMAVYAEVAGLPRRIMIAVPVLTPKLSSLWVGLVTPLPSSLAKPLVESLINEVVVTRPPERALADPPALPFRESVALALGQSADSQVVTRWSDAGLPGSSPADPLPTDPDWAGGSLLVDEQTADSAGPPNAVYAAVTGVGGTRGWYVAPILWSIRGWIDKLVGGVGMRRGRRHPDELSVGDALDFWRVEAIEPDRLVRLRAEMRLPGEAWLEWTIEPVAGGTHLTQRAIFYPRGLTGRIYWYAFLPFHVLIFGRLANGLAHAAEEPEQGDVVPTDGPPPTPGTR
jgi:uncharacterized protein YbjT (DUF2867 family)